ncbi:MAG TPA: peptide-methionine (S)-S-oxide reductase MsrA [Candidatus Paceibacterota bacterium]|nr:peptide-methionine (S)-S-oxide reductase MsrA [Candidatus Paceibacterota bacterium]
MTQTAVFGGGCFWCTEAVFRRLRGVLDVQPGYAGGHVEHPTYEEVSSGTTGHVEVIRFEFDPAQIGYDDLLNVFFATHDPTAADRQGNDIGPQYRSVIFYADDGQRDAAREFIERLNRSGEHGAPIVTTMQPLDRFWPAEDYHKKYYETHRDEPYCQTVINPKLEKVQRKFHQLLTESNI